MRARSLVGASLLLLCATPVGAFVVLTADNVCGPTDDPCVVDQPYESSTGLPLDFGRRTVLVTGNGSFTGGLDLSCGALVVDRPGVWLRVTEFLSLPPVRIAAVRGCSSSPQTSCFVDADCGEGTCSVGDGGIRMGGSIVAPSRWVELTAAGDIEIAGRIRGAANLPGAGGGRVFITSTGGSIALTAPLNVTSSRRPGEYGPTYAGYVELLAAGDVLLQGTIRANGGDGLLRARAGRDLRVESTIRLRAHDADLKSGDVALTAGHDLVVAGGPGRAPAMIDLKGGSAYRIAGDAGEGTLVAGGRIDIERGTLLRSDCGRGNVPIEWIAYPGSWSLDAGAGVAIDGEITARGCKGLNFAAEMVIVTDGSFVLGPNGTIDLRAGYGYRFTLRAGPRELVVLDGVVDMTGFVIEEHDPGYEFGEGGTLNISGGNVSIGGTIRSGGDSTGGEILVDACRVHLRNSALVDNSLGLQVDNWADPTNLFYVGESMTADPGSSILAAATGGTEIVYRDADKPPSLLGTAIPPPVLTLAPNLTGCPVCGNDEVDEGEQCDDGNTTAGDGCDGDCQTE